MAADYALLKRQNPISAYLKRNGIRIVHDKFSCVSPDHDDRNPSASIFDGDERWRCHGCEKAGDIIDLVMLHRGMDHAEAVRHLGGETWDGEPKPKPPRGFRPQLVRDFGPPPEGTPPLKPPEIALRAKSGNMRTFRIDHLWPYRDQDGVLQAYVARVDHDPETGGKKVFPVRWHTQHGAWMQGGFTKGERRPLFNEDKLALNPGAEVLLVEGEKAATFAEALFPDMIACTWLGGTSNVEHADFSALKGRHVTVWRDNDDKGREAMDVAARKARPAVLLAVPMHKDWQAAWDVVDVAAEPGAALAAFHNRRPYRLDESPRGKAGTWLRVSEGGWLPDHVHLIDANGQVKTSDASNAHYALLHHPAFQTLGWDCLSQDLVFEGRSLIPEAAIHLIRTRLHAVCGLEIPIMMAANLIDGVARHRPVNVLADRIRNLSHDGIARLDRLHHYFGVPHSAWAVMGFRRWFLGHVKRLLQPGWKQDLILVLEGEQGQGKSTALQTLANAFGYNGFDNVSTLGAARMNESDLMLIAKRTIIELGEMSALKKADMEHFKNLVSRTSDTYRKPYGRDTVEVPRTASFAGTSNLTRNYLADPTGARRFVPMLCERPCEIAAIAGERDQIYAEARTRIEGGEQTWFTREEETLQKVETDKRKTVNYLEERLTDLTETVTVDVLEIETVLEHLGMPTSAFRDRRTAMPDVVSAMAQLGWTWDRVQAEGTRRKRFSRNPKPPGRPWNKVQLFPPD